MKKILLVLSVLSVLLLVGCAAEEKAAGEGIKTPPAANAESPTADNSVLDGSGFSDDFGELEDDLAEDDFGLEELDE